MRVRNAERKRGDRHNKIETRCRIRRGVWVVWRQSLSAEQELYQPRFLSNALGLGLMQLSLRARRRSIGG
jgi:hypothetical protein